MTEILSRRFGVSAGELREMAELIVRLVVALVAVVYIVGLLIVNLHFRRFDLTSFGLVRSEYGLAGTLWLVVVLVSHGFAQLCRSGWSSVRDAGHERRWLKATWHFVMMLLTAIAFLIWSFDVLTDSVTSFRSWHMWIVVLTILFVSVTPNVLIRSIKQAAIAWSSDPDAELPIRALIAQVLTFVASLGIYATFAYPAFPAAYGGGRLLLVRVVLTPEGYAIATRSGFSRDEIGIPAALVADTAEWLVIAPPDAATPVTLRSKPTLRLRHDVVRAIVSEEEAQVRDKRGKPAAPVPKKQASR